MSNQPINLLFLYTDEQRLDTLACYGNAKIQMPTLNRLAEQSVVFDQPYCTQPVCTPSRGSLMTGLMPHAHGATTNNTFMKPGTRCLPEWLPDAAREAYRTAHMGKWHIGDEIFAQHGFDEWVSTESYTNYFSEGRDRARRCSYFHFLVECGFMPTLPEAGETGFSRDFAARVPERYGKPHFTASEAAAFIRQNECRPWMLAVNFLEPHAPFHSPRDGQYDPAEVDLPENFNDLPNADQPSFLKGNADMTEDQLRRVTARYWGLNSLVDTHVGRILQVLEATGQRERTLIVFTSDHGDMMGSHRLMNKCVMFKEATQVPMLVSLPGQQCGGRITGPVSQVDLAPTLLDLMGFAVPPDAMNGRSLAGLCRQAAAGKTLPGEGVASPCVTEWNPGHQPNKARVRSLVTPQQERYSHYENGEHEFYDLAADPGETRNLARDSAFQDRIAELRRQLADWQQATRDTAPPIQ